jgi:hypothetical protein
MGFNRSIHLAVLGFALSEPQRILLMSQSRTGALTRGARNRGTVRDVLCRIRPPSPRAVASESGHSPQSHRADEMAFPESGQYFRASEPPGIVILLQKLRSRIMQDHVNQSNSD